jgi:type II secretory pathway pseudopilin PulG
MLKQKGQSIVEFIIAVGLASIFLPALLTGLVASREGKAQQTQRLEATTLLKEAEEAVRIARENNWSSVSSNGIYHPVISGNTWNLASGDETINGYIRQIVISDVRRDGSEAVVSTGGTVDPSTKKIVTTVSWNTPFSSSVDSTMYLTRFLSNTTFVETTDTQFGQGTLNATVVTNTSGGEVTLGAGGHGSWCAPNLSIASVDLPKQGVANAVYAVQGQVVAGTGDNASGVSFAQVAISNPPYPTPPAGSITATFDGYKTNGVFGDTNYAYLATDTNSKEIVIIDLNNIINGKYQEVGYFDAPGNGNGNSIYVSGNIGYMTDGDILYTFDLSDKSGSRSQLGSVTLAGTGNRVVVNGSYAYIAVGATTNQLQIIQVSTDGKTLTVVGQATVNGQAAKDVFINGTATRAYLVTAESATQKEFFIVDIAAKTGNQPTLGSYETNGMDPKGVTVVPGNKAIIVGNNAEEYQVIDITNENNLNLPRCGGLNIDTGINGLSSVVESDGDAYSYIITGDTSSELKIIEGGPGGQYGTAGTFISKTFDAGFSAVFNRLYLHTSQPSQTTIKFQIGIADPINNSCNSVNFTYVGLDKSTSSYFTTDAAIPLDDDGVGFENPGRCLSYKAYLTTSEITQSPTLYDISINYSP